MTALVAGVAAVLSDRAEPERFLVTSFAWSLLDAVSGTAHRSWPPVCWRSTWCRALTRSPPRWRVGIGR